jgi:hypothetical protein
LESLDGKAVVAVLQSLDRRCEWSSAIVLRKETTGAEAIGNATK